MILSVFSIMLLHDIPITLKLKIVREVEQ